MEELAEDLGLLAMPATELGRVELGDGSPERVVLFAGTRVVSVAGRRIEVAREVELRGDGVWIAEEDAAEIRSAWAAGAMAAQPVSRTVEPTPRAEAPRPTAPRATQPTRPQPAFSPWPSAAERKAWAVTLRRKWKYVVVHHSGSAEGNAASFHRAHLGRGWDGLGYDFVIGNGRGSPDGHVEVGYRWTQQKDGAHAGNDEMNQHGVGICLVGNFNDTRPTPAQMRSLLRLCNFLSEYCDIPPANLRLHRHIKSTDCPGAHFPKDFTFGPLAPVGAGWTGGF